MKEPKSECFVIVDCDFDKQKLEEIKLILIKHDYIPKIAEELPDFNVDLLDEKILKGMENAELIIVILRPHQVDKKYANFNVAFEFGHARQIRPKKQIILLFDGVSIDLFSDIRGRNAILIKKDGNWKSELETLIKGKTEERLRSWELPEHVVQILEKHITKHEFQVFAELLYQLADNGFNILDNDRVFNLIIGIFKPEAPDYPIDSAGTYSLLYAINKGLLIAKKEKAEELKRELIKLINLPSKLQQSHSTVVIWVILSLLVKINDKESINSIITFFKRPHTELINYLQGYGWDFENSEEDYLYELLDKVAKLKLQKEQLRLHEVTIQFLDQMLKALIKAIKDKTSEK